MVLQIKMKSDLDKKYSKVIKTPASFEFFIAIHGFIKYIEQNPILSESLSFRIKTNRNLGIPAKYNNLKQIYQGIEDSNIDSDDDLGHERNTIVRDLARIQNKETFDRNIFWKKREVFRNLAFQIYEQLTVQHSPVKK